MVNEFMSSDDSGSDDDTYIVRPHTLAQQHNVW